MTLAIYDLDETLVAGDSCSLFCEFLLAEGIMDESFVQRDRDFMAIYMIGQLEQADYIKFFIGELKHLSIQQIEDLLPRFVETCIKPSIYPQALELIATHKQRGLRPLIISATSAFIVRAAALALDIEDYLAIELEAESGHYTGRIDGIPPFREGKVIRLKTWLEEQSESLDGAYFYTDSINDLPLMEQVDNPIATNPDPKLTEISEQKGWPVVRWNNG